VTRHRFHAICPYFAMFPETFAEHWINAVTAPGDLILDPFCGRGTAPLQALLMDRNAVAGDINPVAYCITRAKTNAPQAASLRRRITQLEREYDPDSLAAEAVSLPEFFSVAYTEATLKQLLYLRRRLRWEDSDGDCMLAALVLGALHGESVKSPSYLSNQMPRTISTKPDYSVRYWRRHGLTAPERDAFALLRNRIDYRYASPVPQGRGRVFRSDVRLLPHLDETIAGRVNAVITSPPYLDITNFEEDQWLRLWFLGGPAYPTRGRISSDDRHRTLDAYWSLIADTWRTFGQLLAQRAHVVMRLGFKSLPPDQIVEGVLGSSVVAQREVDLIQYHVSDIRRRQTDSFRPGSKGCLQEVDVHMVVA
jgi:hypothetical protein